MQNDKQNKSKKTWLYWILAILVLGGVAFAAFNIDSDDSQGYLDVSITTNECLKVKGTIDTSMATSMCIGSYIDTFDKTRIVLAKASSTSALFDVVDGNGKSVLAKMVEVKAGVDSKLEFKTENAGYSYLLTYKGIDSAVKGNFLVNFDFQEKTALKTISRTTDSTQTETEEPAVSICKSENGFFGQILNVCEGYNAVYSENDLEIIVIEIYPTSSQASSSVQLRLLGSRDSEVVNLVNGEDAEYGSGSDLLEIKYTGYDYDETGAIYAKIQVTDVGTCDYFGFCVRDDQFSSNTSDPVVEEDVVDAVEDQIGDISCGDKPANVGFIEGACVGDVISLGEAEMEINVSDLVNATDQENSQVLIQYTDSFNETEYVSLNYRQKEMDVKSNDKLYDIEYMGFELDSSNEEIAKLIVREVGSCNFLGQCFRD